jgi:hypothetical protein
MNATFASSWPAPGHSLPWEPQRVWRPFGVRDLQAGSPPPPKARAAGGEAPTCNEFAQHFHNVEIAASHEAAELIASDSVRYVTAIHGVAARARLGRTEEGEREQPHADASSILERLAV